MAAIDGGLSRRRAVRFGVSVSSAARWHALARRVLPRRSASGDRRSGLIEVYADVILGAIARQPDITLAELREPLARHSVTVGIATCVAVLRAPEDQA